MRDQRCYKNLSGGVLRTNIDFAEAKETYESIENASRAYIDNPNDDNRQNLVSKLQSVNPSWGDNVSDESLQKYKRNALSHLREIMDRSRLEPYDSAITRPESPINEPPLLDLDSKEEELQEVTDPVELERINKMFKKQEYDPLINPPPEQEHVLNKEEFAKYIFLPNIIKNEFDEMFREAGLKNIKLDKLYKEPLDMPGATELKNRKVEKYFDKRSFRDAFIAKLKEIKRDTKSVAEQKKRIERELKDISLNVPEIRESVMKMYEDAKKTEMEETKQYVPPPKEEIQKLGNKMMMDRAKTLFKDIKNTSERFLPGEMLPIKRYIADKKIKKYSDLPADLQNKFVELTLMGPNERKMTLETITEASSTLPTPMEFAGQPPPIAKAKTIAPPGRLQRELAHDPVTISLVVRKKRATHKCKLAPKIGKVKAPAP